MFIELSRYVLRLPQLCPVTTYSTTAGLAIIPTSRTISKLIVICFESHGVVRIIHDFMETGWEKLRTYHMLWLGLKTLARLFKRVLNLIRGLSIVSNTSEQNINLGYDLVFVLITGYRNLFFVLSQFS